MQLHIVSVIYYCYDIVTDLDFRDLVKAWSNICFSDSTVQIASLH